MPPPVSTRRKSTLFVDGVAREVETGLSVAAAIAGAGVASDADGKRHGLFCGMGVCHDCIAVVDGRISQRTCMTPVTDGMRVERQPQRPDIRADNLADLCPLPPVIGHRSMDVLVIGAGPGGLAAAETAAAVGARVVIVDERSTPGGQFFKQPTTAAAKSGHARDAQVRDGATLIARVRSLGVEILSGVTVWGASRDDEDRVVIACHGPQGAFYCRPKMVVIATGAFERPAAIPGWTLPGVMTVGACQTLLRSHATLPGRRILVAGNGPLDVQVASEILAAGGEVVGLVESAAPPWCNFSAAAALLSSDPALALKGMRTLARIEKSRVPIWWRSVVTAIEGNDRAQRATISGPSGVRTIEVDNVLLGGNFRPSNELSRLLGCAHAVMPDGSLRVTCGEDGETSQTDIHVVGEAVRFGGAQLALAEGRLAGSAIAAKLGLDVARDEKSRRRLVRAKAFQAALWSMFAPAAQAPAPTNETLACRCESVSFGRLVEALRHVPPDIATLKRLTRAGMGRCQGRYCGGALAATAGRPVSETQGFLAPQMPLRPIPLAALAVEKPEWGGHKRALLPRQPPLPCPEPLPIQEVATLVVGAGIAGLATALNLADAGEEVAVVERGFPGGLASGGNAGSLHGQLLSFDHGPRAEAGGRPAVRTLVLQRDSIDLWRKLERRCGADFEMKITGGLMVAETEEHLRFLDDKAAVERSVGIECHVIGTNELRRREPALTGALVGAAYCPQEGKINPLVATHAVCAAAAAAGARIFDRTEVTAIRRDGDRFAVETSRGLLRARRIVNAAGAFASRIGAMLGVDIPVFGAPLQMAVTEPVAPAISHLVAHAGRHLTLKQAANGSFLIGGGWTAGLDPVHGHPRPLLSSIEGSLWVAQHVLPFLRKLHVVRTWAAMNIDIDGAPILGEHPDVPGLFNAVTSNGFTLGPVVGEVTAALVCGRDPGRDVSAFSISRFR
jgi:glycine/D-amino acid oxidase-like deaminating enzyme